MSNSLFETKGLLMRKKPLSIAMLIASGVLVSSYVQADNLSTAFTDGKLLGDFRLRYETNDTDNTATKSAEALTLRSRIGFETRSEERRVGKECSSWWSLFDLK